MKGYGKAIQIKRGYKQHKISVGCFIIEQHKVSSVLFYHQATQNFSGLFYHRATQSFSGLFYHRATLMTALFVLQGTVIHHMKCHLSKYE